MKADKFTIGCILGMIFSVSMYVALDYLSRTYAILGMIKWFFMVGLMMFVLMLFIFNSSNNRDKP